MWVARSLTVFIFMYACGAYADSPIDPSIDSLPGGQTGVATTPPPTPESPTNMTNSGNDLGAQAQQNTTTAMKTFQNLTYKKLSQAESDAEDSNPPLTEFPTKAPDNPTSNDSAGYE